ncbi:4-hydroxy-4-methyl-2-oxoglutarate aldolase [Angulomicrobium tetraedrale]|uniref:Putative 4-hydroxy-4-methyl-2-oxoglutarate aldolase n=1 Tax=Ancylobacter tetraedralis TaxID=217068 RepID=A0A839YZT4_9HYPH|nr:4-hydroxy-4-methyl-2-oxoglutarate aldolase [Ancylobacter tetraedralis]MBB3770024.1 4-hydroxy-4-methyl-2-oxoglutarate aldolase [Ancylobacter tetraedralis]
MTKFAPDFPRPTPAQIAAFADIGTATAHEAFGRRGALHHAIKPIRKGLRLLGPAFTAKGKPGDNLTGHAALALAKRGDVIVYSAEAFTEGAAFGDVMAEAALQRGIAGVLIDGAARDGNILRESDLPVFARGLSLKSRGDKDYFGPLAEAIVVGGVEVHPGDLIIGDDDGVVVIPFADIDWVAEVAQQRSEKETALRARLASGAITTWDLFGPAILRRKGIDIEI